MFTGFVREIDSVGRIVIPKQLRKELGMLEEGCKVEMFSDGKQIILKKAENDCVFCKSEADLVEFDGKYVCRACIDKIKSAE